MKAAYFAVTAAALLLAGCSNQPVSTGQAMEVPAQRVIDKSINLPGDGKVLTVIKRDSGPKGSLCSATVSVDGKDVAELNGSEKLSMYLTPGEHILTARLSQVALLCGGMNADATIDVKEPAAYRFGVTVNAEFYLNKTTL